MLPRIAHLLKMKPPIADDRGFLFASGATKPTDGTDGYQAACLFQDTTNGLLYINEGSITSSDFDPVSGFPIVLQDAWTEVVVQTGTYQSTASGGVTISSANARPVSWLFDDAGVALTGDIRAVLSRCLMTIDKATGTLNAIRGQVKMLDGIDTTSTAVVLSPITGYFEMAGTGARSLAGHVAAIRATIEEGASGTTTIAASSFYAGLEVTLNSSRTYVETGKMAGIIVNKSVGSSLWPVGILVQNSISPMVLGAAVADTAIEVGSFSPPSTNFLGLQMNFQNAGTSLGRLTGMQIDVDDTSTHSNTIACARFYSEKVSGTGSHEHWGIMAQATVTAGKVANVVSGMFIAIVKDSAVVGTNGGDHRAFAIAGDVDFSGTGDYADTPDMITGAIIGTQLGHTGVSATGQKITGVICAQMGGDSKTITAGAFFKCIRKNSISASKADYGLDMYYDEAGAYLAIDFAVADIRFAASAYLKCYDTALSDNDATSAPRGSIATTTHGTGGGSGLFVSDGSNWQKITID